MESLSGKVERKKGYHPLSMRKGKELAGSSTKEIVGEQQKTATEGHTDAQQQLMDGCAERIIQGRIIRDEGGEGKGGEEWNRGRGKE